MAALAALLLLCTCFGAADAKKNLAPTAHIAVDMGSQFLKISAEQSVRGALLLAINAGPVSAAAAAPARCAAAAAAAAAPTTRSS